MGRNEDSTEILVHITAPSAAADDARYRALAQAYLDFEPKGFVNLSQHTSSKPSAAPSDRLISPQASFSSVWDNIGSPRRARANQQSAPLPGIHPFVPLASSQLRDNSQLPWVAPPSEVPDSMPDNDIRALAFNTPTRVLKYLVQSTEQTSVSSGGASGKVAERGTNALEHLLERGPGLDSSPSIRRPHKRTLESSGLVQIDVDVSGVTEGGAADRSFSGSASAAAPLAHQTTIPGTLPENRSSYSTGTSDWIHLTQLISTEPPVANHRLGPRAPQHLEQLAEQMQMGGKYRPKQQARDMRPFERGYWLVRLDGWAFEDKAEAWGFLGNYIRRDGKAGWGTRACRDESWGWIRLYGWEHIAAELYMLLYVASYRKLKYMEVKYYDAAGDVLIVVGPRATKPKSG